MAGVAGTQQSIRKALGAIKDSTTVGLAKVNSEYKELDVAIVKATNHVEQLVKEKHLRTIFDAVSASRPRADVAYCINALAKRLAKTHNWAVAIKTLIVIHRALREVPTFREELVNHTSTRGHMLNLSHFKDDSSPNAWDYSAWVRTYALYLEERLECFRVLKCDVETERSRTSELDTVGLLEQLPALQQLLFRLLGCQPEGAAIYNSVIGHALSLVANESVKIYNAINSGTLNLVDKFFEMQRHDALKALEIYKKAGSQAERLSEFYEICKGLDFRQNESFPKIEQPPMSFIGAMEEYLKDASRSPPLNQTVGKTDKGLAPPVLAIESNKANNASEELKKPSGSSPESLETAKTEVQIQEQTVDLLGLNDINGGATEMEQKNALSLAVVSNDPHNTASDEANGCNGWELALVGASSSNESAVAKSKLAGGLDRLTLDSLYDDALMRQSNPTGYLIGQAAPNPFEPFGYLQDPFYASNSVAPPVNVQMAAIAQQQALMMQQQHQQAVGQNSSNPFGNPFGGTGAPPYPEHHPYAGYM